MHPNDLPSPILWSLSPSDGISLVPLHFHFFSIPQSHQLSTIGNEANDLPLPSLGNLHIKQKLLFRSKKEKEREVVALVAKRPDTAPFLMAERSNESDPSGRGEEKRRKSNGFTNERAKRFSQTKRWFHKQTEGVELQREVIGFHVVQSHLLSIHHLGLNNPILTGIVEWTILDKSIKCQIYTRLVID